MYLYIRIVNGQRITLFYISTCHPHKMFFSLEWRESKGRVLLLPRFNIIPRQILVVLNKY